MSAPPEAASAVKAWLFPILFTTLDIEPGGCIEHQGKIWQVIELINERALCELYSL